MLIAMVMLIFFPILILSSVVIGLHFGQERKIGFWWTCFFCIFLSPLIGIGLAIASQAKSDNTPYSEFCQTIILFLILLSLITGVVCLVIAIKALNQPTLFLYWIGVGLIGLA